MLPLHITAETWDPNVDNGPDMAKGRFGTKDFGTLQLEHSLIAISKWEEKYHKSFLATHDKTGPEMLYYIECMTINKNVNPEAYQHLTEKQLNEIAEYINDSHSATTFSDEDDGPGSKRNKQIITSELIYYWMFANQIPKECEKWHIQRLISLIRIFSIKNQPQDKKSRRARITDKQKMYADRAALNAKRKAQYHTTG